MAEILLIRHGKTVGNLEGRYIGSQTDEPLCETGIRELMDTHYEPVDLLYVSPMKRCLETAELLWPGMEKLPVEELKECNFGAFENHNYQELTGDPAYQAWIDSGGTLPFPNGESMEQFKQRCCKGFQRIVQSIEKRKAQSPDGKIRVGIVAHGGTIMAILEQYGVPKKTYFDYQVKNGCGYRLTPAEGMKLWNCQCLQ